MPWGIIHKGDKIMWASWLVISAIVRVIAMGFIIYLSTYLIGVIFGTKVEAEKDDFAVSMIVFSVAGALFYLFQFILPN